MDIPRLPSPRPLLDDFILPFVEGRKPEAIVIQTGVDSLVDDPMVNLALSNRAHVGVVQIIGCWKLLRSEYPQMFDREFKVSLVGMAEPEYERSWGQYRCRQISREVPLSH